MGPASVMEPARSRQNSHLGFLKGYFTEETIFEAWAGLKWPTEMLRHPWLSTEERQPHPSPKGQGLEMVFLDLVRAGLIAEELCDTSYSSRRAQSLAEPHQNRQGAGEINTLISLSFCSLIFCLCLLLARSIWTPETGVPGLSRWSLNSRTNSPIRRRQKEN